MLMTMRSGTYECTNARARTTGTCVVGARRQVVLFIRESRMLAGGPVAGGDLASRSYHHCAMCGLHSRYQNLVKGFQGGGQESAEDMHTWTGCFRCAGQQRHYWNRKPDMMLHHLVQPKTSPTFTVCVCRCVIIYRLCRGGNPPWQLSGSQYRCAAAQPWVCGAGST